VELIFDNTDNRIPVSAYMSFLRVLIQPKLLYNYHNKTDSEYRMYMTVELLLNNMTGHTDVL